MARRRRNRSSSSPKRILQQSITAQEGVNLIERRLLEMGFLWYPTGGLEAGIDGHLEIRDSETGDVYNAIIQVQSKATREPLGKLDFDTFHYLCDERDINYWMRGNAPVILVRSRPETNEAYWVSIKDYFADPVRRKLKKIIFDKKRDSFDSSAKERLRDLAIPRHHGVYFTPSRSRERLLSNLLPVTAVAERVFVADTEFRIATDLWDAAKRAGVEIGSEWILRDKRILSLHDLTKVPWPEFCGRVTVESFNTWEWSRFNDHEKEKEFAQLLNRCLTAKLSRYPIRRDRQRECYYFCRTKDLGPRRWRYQSVRKSATKTVFRTYPSKKDPRVIAYCRHTAMEGYFRRYGDIWYLEIVPTYFFTTDGTNRHPNYESKLKGIKAQERNNAVRNHVMMWASVLGERDSGLFDAERYTFLRFGELLAFDIDAGLNDASWVPFEESGTIVSENDGELELFGDEN